MRDLKDVVVEYRKTLATERMAWEVERAADAAWRAGCMATEALRVELQRDHVGPNHQRVLVTLPGVTVMVRDSQGYKEARVEFYDLEGNQINE